MTKQKLLSIARAVLARPTAPFHEAQVAEEILLQLEKCPHVDVRRDAFGNLIARYQRGRAKPRHAFAAHMDHPGWVKRVEGLRVERLRGKSPSSQPLTASTPQPSSWASSQPLTASTPQPSSWEFLGSVPPEYLRDPKIVEFGAFAMWDLPACEVRDGLLHSRACDDLLGCTAILAMFHELEKEEVETSCVGLFTRAEEVGFVGAIKLAQSGLLPKSLTIISLETSAERPPAKIGAGPILRVGDRTSIFDSGTTAAFADVARNAKIEVQRCLMSGGTCEATAYQLYGYRSAALCIALGNYHNCGPNQEIAAEHVSANDLAGLAKLCTEIARHSPKPGASEAALRRRLEENARKYRRHFSHHQ